MEPYKPLFLVEFTVQDFKKQASSLTKKFRKERNKVKGAESALAKVVDFDFNNNTIIFLTEPTFDFSVLVNPNGKASAVPDNSYTMKVQFVDLDKWKDSTWAELSLTSFREILTVADVKLDCDCMAFTFQGARYNLSQIRSAIYPTGIADPVWGPRHDGGTLLCKHLLGLMSALEFNAAAILGQIRRRAKEKGITE